MITRGWIVAALVLATSACSSDGDSGAVTAEYGGSTTTADLGDESLLEAFVDPADPAHLVLRYNACWVDPVPHVVESDETVSVSVDGEVLEKPCNPTPVSISLSSPLLERSVIDAADGREVGVTNLPTVDPSTLVVAECTGESPANAVAREVDGGLRSRVLACDGSWMAVDTSTNACPANEGSVAAGCLANHHVAIFRNVDGYWKVVGFDDCVNLRRQYEVPDAICDAATAAMG